MHTLIAPAFASAGLSSKSEIERLPSGVAALRRIRELEALLERLVASWHASPPLMHGRAWHRVRYEKPLILTPMDGERNQLAGKPRLVQGRDVSLGGCSFYHGDPLPCSRVALTFGVSDEDRVTLMVRLTWCRFTQGGIYQSGGKFLKPVELRIDEHVNWGALPNG